MAKTISRLKKYFLGVVAVCYALNLPGQQIVVDDNRQSPFYGHFILFDLPEDALKKLSESSEIQYADFFFVKVDQSEYAMAGTYSVSDSSVIFKPLFQPDARLIHTSYFSPDTFNRILNTNHDLTPLAVSVTFKNSEVEAAFVSRISPAADTIPANTLRLYVYFSSPMGLQNPYDYIKIIDQSEQELNKPFVELKEGFWNDTMTRLTLFFHPGRIKRGVGPNMSQGAIFKEGEHYKLSIIGNWQDANGQTIQPFKKTFFATQPLRTSIDISNWVIDPPTDLSTDPVQIKTDRLLDEALVRRMIDMYKNGEQVSGDWTIHKKILSFIPKLPWSKGTYTIQINENVEDIAGNSLLKVFDVDKEQTTPTAPVKTKIEFIVR
ncbi:hypothetical protein E1176_09850 [Fulvivirga sp. RKSG066]|uniref:Ig-like domain-containing protein n=1 Tax=Fulvivirga aurantia TaxID=2529383 RepID=UPI0012BCA647|nr:Ig-like domain-containing protein [Fulvivirga aurantia]MTI21321.1 hypothetical protein [Fulvivirga aurantia]